MTVLLTNKKIIKDWIDYNGHMNLSYYILVFDMGAEVILSKFEMGEHSAKTTINVIEGSCRMRCPDTYARLWLLSVGCSLPQSTNFRQ